MSKAYCSALNDECRLIAQTLQVCRNFSANFKLMSIAKLMLLTSVLYREQLNMLHEWVSIQ